MANEKDPYKIRVSIIVHSATTQQFISKELELVEHWSSENGYYYMKLSNGKFAYYPIINTIIEQI